MGKERNWNSFLFHKESYLTTGLAFKVKKVSLWIMKRAGPFCLLLALPLKSVLVSGPEWVRFYPLTINQSKSISPTYRFSTMYHSFLMRSSSTQTKLKGESMDHLKLKFFNAINRSFAISCLAFLLAGSNLYGDNSKGNKLAKPCAAEVSTLIKQQPYKILFKTLKPNVPNVNAALVALNAATTPVDQANAYANVVAVAQAIVTELNNKLGLGHESARVVITDPDGLVVFDSAKPVVPGPNANNYTSYIAGSNPATFSQAINVNHNSRIAILDSQLYVCGVGAETKESNTTGTEQSYVAIRAAPNANKIKKTYLNNVGSVRLSANTPDLP